MKTFFFILRKALIWLVVAVAIVVVWANVIGRGLPWIVPLILFGTLAAVFTTTFSHVRRVRLIADRIDAATLASRHRRQIEIPFAPGEAFDLVEAAVRELPFVESVESARDSLQVHARVRRMDPYAGGRAGGQSRPARSRDRRDLVRAVVSPSDGTGSVTLVCEPEGAAWIDWFLVDHGANLENAEAITRAITRRVADRRKGEQASTRETETEKALAVARLSLLHAQVEPHFLYNTLASAQLLTRSDPPKADRMLGYLITYLRHSLPSAEVTLSTLGSELERASAYLEILAIRMGERLRLQIQVSDALYTVPLPPMMLQTLVENAIKHGLEPVPGGGTIWILAREAGDQVAITVADDGRGFSEEGGGTGIGLKNVRERLALAYGKSATFTLASNFPKGVAATVTVPRAGPPGGANA